MAASAPKMMSTQRKASLLATPRRAHFKGHGPCSGCNICRTSSMRAVVVSAAATKANSADEMKYMSQRMSDVTAHFPSALSADDFLMRAEVALCAHGFRGDNCITCTNLCRDESTGLFKQKIDNVFGSSFNINGLGACLTCGNLGFKAGFSHAPNMDGKERYVFFSFPHIGICSEGEVGQIHRPGRGGTSAACGALIGALGQFQADKSVMTAYAAGKHDPQDPEFAILKQRLANRIQKEGADVDKMTLVDMTALAERTITEDLESMIADTVDPSQQDYAVITGVHIHNWGNEGTGAPTMEWIAPSTVYVVNNGKRTNINLQAVPAMTPRQLSLLQDAQAPEGIIAASTGSTTVVESKHADPAAGPLRA